MSLYAWLIAAVGPLLSRILASLGLSLVAVTGATVALSTVKDTLLGAVGAAPAAFLQLAGLYGVWEGLGWLLACATFSVTWSATTKSWSLLRIT